ncbi:MAG: exodeoxyribonuclease VII large subunit [Clostridiales bacterium]|nr:exodeoxyribonuclease VII large subunit [Clostridiales bacterium]
MQVRILSVADVNRYIKRIISSDAILHSLRVQGEISNYKLHSSGHMYFSIKDNASKLSCIMFKNNASKIKFDVSNGMKVTLKGYVSVYERDGQYQLYVSNIEPVGLGSLHLAYQQLKEKLEKEGLFDKDKKKKLPYIPTSVGIVTSQTGAAIRDVISVIKRRFPKANIVVFPALVQGIDAGISIVDAIELANTYQKIDVLIITRGGGSIEELWPFNEEIVARAIFNSQIPVVSAVGHESDYTIADFVADLRAPTPSVAAELVVPDIEKINEQLVSFYKRAVLAMKARLREKSVLLEHVKNSYFFKYPYANVNDKRQTIDLLEDKLIKSFKRKLSTDKNNLINKGDRLNSLSPLSVLARGYSYLEKDYAIIKTVSNINKGDLITATVSDGKLHCKVMDVKKEVPS